MPPPVEHCNFPKFMLNIVKLPDNSSDLVGFIIHSETDIAIFLGNIMGCTTKPIILTCLSWFLETCHILATRWNFWICFLQIATTCPVVRGLQTMFTLCLLCVETPRFPKASILVLATEMFENLFVWKASEDGVPS